jgi:hypothetical protein
VDWGTSKLELQHLSEDDMGNDFPSDLVQVANAGDARLMALQVITRLRGSSKQFTPNLLPKVGKYNFGLLGNYAVHYRNLCYSDSKALNKIVENSLNYGAEDKILGNSQAPQAPTFFLSVLM